MDKKNAKRAVVLFTPGFEEIETVTIIDVLRRAGITVTTASIQADPVEGAHGIRIQPDAVVGTIRAEDFDALVLPGGMPNARTLATDGECQRIIREAKNSDRVLGAICAAPIALQSAGVLGGQQLTSHPVVESELDTATYRSERVVRDGRLITSRGPGTAMEFALALVEKLAGKEIAQDVARPMLLPQSAEIG